MDEGLLLDGVVLVVSEGDGAHRLDGEVDGGEDRGDELALVEELGLLSDAHPAVVELLLSSHGGVDELDHGSLLEGLTFFEFVFKSVE